MIIYKANVSISIGVVPKDVFFVLKDFRNYYQWNPWITIAGEAIQHERIRVSRRQFSLWKLLRYKINLIKSSEQIVWSSDNWFNFLVSTKRDHMIYTMTDGTSNYVTKFYFYGPLAGLASMIYIKAIHRGIKMEAAALKHYCEKRYNAGV